MGEHKESKKDSKKHKKKKEKKEKKSKKEDKESKKHHKSERKKDGSSKKHRSHHHSSSSSSSSDDDEPAILGPSLPPADFGPSLPPPGTSSLPAAASSPPLPSASIGPSAAPPRPADEDEDSGDEAGPSLPGPALPEDHAGGTAGEKKKVAAGPSLPAGVDLEKLAHQTAKVDWERVAREEEEDELDLVGPARPGQVTIGYAKASAAAEARAIATYIQQQEEAEAAKLPRHEAWMTMMPEEKELSLTLDEQASNRTFQRKEKQARGDTSEWTDTPADKARKAREKAMGLGGGQKRKAGDAVVDQTAARQSTLIQQYNAAVRPKSLFELHQEGLKKSKSTGTSNEVKEKDFLASGWDRSEMEQGRGAMNPKEAKKMLADAAGLDGRFGSRTFQ